MNKTFSRGLLSVLTFFFVIIMITESIFSLKLITGESSIYKLQQEVTTDYLTVDLGVQAFFQYFECLDPNHANKFIFYFGNKLHESTQVSAYLGYYPYTMKKNESNLYNLDITENKHSQNQFANVIGVDIVRDAGFNNVKENAYEQSYEIIMRDIIIFVNKFFTLRVFQPPEKSGFSQTNDRSDEKYWKKYLHFYNEIQVTLVGG